VDAGTVGSVPPSYNPSWVQPGMIADASGSRNEISVAPLSPPASEVYSSKR
jgi:hypothetical protein